MVTHSLSHTHTHTNTHTLTCTLSHTRAYAHTHMHSSNTIIIVASTVMITHIMTSDAVRRRIDNAHADLESLGGSERTLSSTSYMYTGESLLEMVLSDHNYKYHNGDGLLSGSDIRAEHKVA